MDGWQRTFQDHLSCWVIGWYVKAGEEEFHQVGIWQMVHADSAFITHLTFANNNNNKFNSQVLQHKLKEKKHFERKKREIDALAWAFSFRKLQLKLTTI